jgi:hypothetical protein
VLLPLRLRLRFSSTREQKRTKQSHYPFPNPYSHNRWTKKRGHSTSLTGSDLEEVACHNAKESRQIVQACLREEEWQDAEQAFVRVIKGGIAERPARSKPSNSMYCAK